MEKKLYKVLVNGESCHGGNMVWDLPKQLKNGKWKPGKWHKVDGAISVCERGLHLTTDPSQWLVGGCSIYEAEARGIKDWADNKCVCSSARLIKKVTFNTGVENSGEYNAGNWNAGYGNAGYGNAGNWNAGDGNAGDRNAGDWNASDYNNGFCNTQETPFYMFNKPCTAKRSDISFPDFFYFNLIEWVDYTEEEKTDAGKKATGGYLKTYTYKEAWLKSFEKAGKEDIKKLLALPNFDYTVFEKLSGITEELIKDKLK